MTVRHVFTVEIMLLVARDVSARITHALLSASGVSCFLLFLLHAPDGFYHHYSHGSGQDVPPVHLL